MTLPFPTPRAAGAASNKSVKPAAVVSINSAPAADEAEPFGAFFTPLLANAGITTCVFFLFVKKF